MYYLVFDLEMSGGEPGWHEIIQIGAILYDENWNFLGDYLCNVCPENKEAFSRPAEEIHDLTWDELQNELLIDEVLEDFEDWMLETMFANSEQERQRRALRNVVLCGQSVVNDIMFLKFAYKDCRMEWPFSYTQFDLFTLTFLVFRVLRKSGVSVPKSRSLGSVAEWLGFERETTTHNALEDAEITAKCFKALMVRFADKMQIGS